MATRVAYDNARRMVSLGSMAEVIVWSNDGRYLYVGTHDRGLAAIDVASGRLVYEVGGQDAQIPALALSPDGETLAAGLANDGSIRLIAAATGDLLQTIWPAHTNWPEVITYSPDGRVLASGGDDGRIVIWDAASGEQLQELHQGGYGIWGMAFSPNGKLLVAGFQTEYTFQVWNTDDWSVRATFEGDQAADLAFSPDGTRIVTAGGGIHEANLWEVATGRQIFNLREAPGWVWAVSYAPDGKLVASGGIGEVVILWDTATGLPVRELYTGPDFIQALAFSPDGHTLATAGSEVLLWDMTTP